MDNFFNITVKTHLESYLILFDKTTQMLVFGGFTLEANIFKSSHFCQPLFECNFTQTP